jgi:hypothetical protein
VEVDLLKQFPDEVIALQFTLLAKAIRACKGNPHRREISRLSRLVPCNLRESKENWLWLTTFAGGPKRNPAGKAAVLLLNSWLLTQPVAKWFSTHQRFSEA